MCARAAAVSLVALLMERRGFPCEGQCGGASSAVLRRPKDGSRLCRACFFAAFEAEVLHTIVTHNLLPRGERIALAVSGGKDSTVLAAVLTKLNRAHGLGAELVLLSVDEGIRGYRDDSLDAVRRTAATHEDHPELTVVSYKDLYGWSMDEIVEAVGRRNNCAFCGVFRRQALERGAALVGAHKIATGHNADDVAETVLMNLLRGDIARLGRCAAPSTEGPADASSGAPRGPASIPRVKPFLYCYEKEIVLYARHAKLDYVSTECKYSPGAYRGFAREFLKDLEAVRSSVIGDILHSAAAWGGGEGSAGGGGGLQLLLRRQGRRGAASAPRWPPPRAPARDAASPPAGSCARPACCWLAWQWAGRAWRSQRLAPRRRSAPPSWPFPAGPRAMLKRAGSGEALAAASPYYLLFVFFSQFLGIA